MNVILRMFTKVTFGNIYLYTYMSFVKIRNRPISEFGAYLSSQSHELGIHG